MPLEAHRTGVVLMTYGSATTAEGVPEYLAHIYGRTPTDESIAEFKQRYTRIGGSPLVELTQRQASELERSLGPGYVVRTGMRHSHPFIEEAVTECKEAGATRIIGIILSPQFSSFIMEGYCTALVDAATKYGFGETEVQLIEAWPDEPQFIELIAKRVQEALGRLVEKDSRRVSVVFTTHSLPERVVASDPDYLNQLETTRTAILAQLSEHDLAWYAAYQSAGHTPEAWLKPDLTDVLGELRDAGETRVLVVPIQFLSDHLEVLYDLDVAAQAQCDGYRISYNRIELPNTDPKFIGALAAIVRRAL